MSKIHILVFIQLAALMGLLILTVWVQEPQDMQYEEFQMDHSK